MTLDTTFENRYRVSWHCASIYLRRRHAGETQSVTKLDVGSGDVGTRRHIGPDKTMFHQTRYRKPTSSVESPAIATSPKTLYLYV